MKNMSIFGHVTSILTILLDFFTNWHTYLKFLKKKTEDKDLFFQNMFFTLKFFVFISHKSL